jgi:hypothetical protein
MKGTYQTRSTFRSILGKISVVYLYGINASNSNGEQLVYWRMPSSGTLRRNNTHFFAACAGCSVRLTFIVHRLLSTWWWRRYSSESPFLTRATRRNIPEDGIFYSHSRENLRSYSWPIVCGCSWIHRSYFINHVTVPYDRFCIWLCISVSYHLNHSRT